MKVVQNENDAATGETCIICQRDLIVIRCCLLSRNTWTYTPPHQQQQLRYVVTLACTQPVPAVSVLGCNGRHLQAESVLRLFNLHTSHQCQFFANITACTHSRWCCLHSYIPFLGQLSGFIIIEMSVRKRLYCT